MKMSNKFRQFMAVFLCVLMITKIVMPSLATVVATDSNATANVEHLVLNTGENCATSSNTPKASSSNAACVACGKEPCECVICATCGKKNCTEHTLTDIPKIGDTIWIRSKSMVYRNRTSENGHKLIGDYEVKIVNIFLDDNNKPEWYEVDYKSLGPGEAFLIIFGYKYVHAEDTVPKNPGTTTPVEEYRCNCGEDAPADISGHADSCLRKQYIMQLIKTDSGTYKTAGEIYEDWDSYDEETRTDILNVLKVYVRTTYDELMELINANKSTEEMIVDTMDSFVEVVEQMPESEEVKNFDEAEANFSEIYAIADRDSVLPKDEADKYEAAYRAFASAMGRNGDTVTVDYPGTDLIEELKEEVGKALDLLDDAEELYASLEDTQELSSFTVAKTKKQSVIELDERYAAAKAKVDAILEVKPDLFESDAETIANTDHKVNTVAENIQMNLFNYGPLINIQQSNQGFMPFTHSEGSYGWAVDSAGNVPAGDAGGWPMLKTVLSSEILLPYITESNGVIKKGPTQYLFDPNYTAERVDYNTYKNNISSRGPGNNAPYQYHSIYFPVNNTDGSGTGLFQKEGSYFVYDSAKNAAWYNPETKKFEIYDYILRPAYTEYDGSVRSGNFLPFNQGHTQGREDYQKETYVKEWTYNNVTYHSTVAKTETVSTKPANAKTAYRLWGNNSDSEVDLWFGLNFEFDFYQPMDGKVDNEAMVFEFLGDDDVFIYIDDVLILDIGGTHAAATGTINFATGAVTNPEGFGQYSNSGKRNSTIYELMKSALGNNLDDSQFIDSNGDGKLDTFKDYTTHNLKFYYLERGGNISYCKLKFNMDPLPVGGVTLQKLVTGVNSKLSDDQSYTFTVEAMDANNQTVNGMKYQLIGNSTVYTVNSGGTIALCADQVASFTNLTAGTTITFTEIVDSNVTGTNTWTLNGKVQNGNTVSTVVGENGSSAKFVCTNTRKTGSVTIKKVLEGDRFTPDDSYQVIVKIGGQPYTGNASKNSNSSNQNVIFDNNGKISLKAGEQVIITGIPSGMSYEVTEILPSLDSSAAYSYETPKYTNAQGTISANANTQVTITNTLRFLYGELEICKSGIDSRDHYGNDFGPSGEAQSTIYRIQGTSNSGVLVDMQVVIKGNGTAVIKNIPVGTYKVTERMEWSWRYSNTESEKSVEVRGGIKTTTSFSNTRGKHDWLSGDCYSENWWGNFKTAVTQSED